MIRRSMMLAVPVLALMGACLPNDSLRISSPAYAQSGGYHQGGSRGGYILGIPHGDPGYYTGYRTKSDRKRASRGEERSHRFYDRAGVPPGKRSDRESHWRYVQDPISTYQHNVPGP
ncbi:MAG TPA: hypothetical protein VJ890_21450 [Vineibacter sp.]|nr:hypothetical protein [Vineibacter sp.]